MKKKKPPLLKKLAMRWGERQRRLAGQKQGVVFNKTAEVIPAPTKDNQDITVILTVYRRPGYVAQQIEALRAQTYPPAQIWLWCNESGAPIPDFSDIADRVIVSNFNWKFFGRFALANLVQTKYIALFDDDILPQPKWFENCLKTIETGHDGILGGSGVLLPVSGGYSAKEKVGWNGKHSNTVETVDLVGHAWFSDKRHFSYMWREEPFSWDNGEDIHFSCMALKHGGVKTYVPPHPADDMTLWSCDPQFGKIAGGGAAATYKSADHKNIRDDAVRYYCQNGWQVVSEGKKL